MSKTIFILAAFVFLSTACNNKPAQPAAPPAVAVDVTTVDTGNAVYYDIYPATIAALNQVDIRPQVAGYITGIFFKDGDHVVKGQKLYTIDQQQYEANYQQALANVAVQKTNLDKAQKDADRYHFLDKQDAIAKQQVDYADASLNAAKKQVDAAEANVRSVETSLKYSTIYAPFDGTIGISQVKVGTAVSPGSQVLNSVSQDDPLAVDLLVDQKQIPRFTQLLATGGDQKDSVFTLVLPDGTVYPNPGRIVLIDRAVDPQTGTIKTRLVFSNPKDILKPGITGNVRVKNVKPGAMLIPYKAVTEQMGEYIVYVVIPGSKVTQRKITLGAMVADKVIVTGGLEPGEKIVIDGVQKLRDSTTIREGGAKPPAAGKKN
ncbi:MAG TPA: efflux RND transporter periplasmic adaptor subunit [Chitinophagaceae bacterium]|nr:efflux RND transporter periplasmic adaptor subunit [Chitinophagaceae bacterium]